MKMTLPAARNLTSVSHDGKAVMVAVTEDPDGTRLVYTVRKDGAENPQVAGAGEASLPDWEGWAPVPFPGLIATASDDPSVISYERANFGVPAESPTRVLIRSRYRSSSTAHLGPVQLISAYDHVYVFRTESDGVVSVDRFILDGRTNRLLPTLELRHRVAEKRYLDEADDDGTDSLSTLNAARTRQFFEPTVELGFLPVFDGSRVAVALVKTPAGARWHVASVHDSTLTMTSVRASASGWFDLLDDLTAPGIVDASISLDSVPTAPPTVAVYDLQQQAGSGAQTTMLKGARRLMVSVPTDDGIHTLDFGIDSDGLLAGDMAAAVPLRGMVFPVHLSPTSLSDVRALIDGPATSPTRIEGLLVSDDEMVDIEASALDADVSIGDSISLDGVPPLDDVRVAEAVLLGDLQRKPNQRKSGDSVLRLRRPLEETVAAGTRVTVLGSVSTTRRVVEDADFESKMLVVDGDVVAGAGDTVILSDEISIEADVTGLGSVQPSGHPQLRGYGDIVGLAVSEAGKIRVRAPGHGLRDGERVAVAGGGFDLNGEHRVIDKVDGRMTIAAPWRRRRLVAADDVAPPRTGITFIERASLRTELEMPTGACVVEFWLRTTERRCDVLAASERTETPFRGGWGVGIDDGNVLVETASGGRLVSTAAVADGQWHHVAVAIDGDHAHVLVDGRDAGGANGFGTASRGNGRLVLGTGVNGAVRSYGGDLAEVRVWNQPRTDSEIATGRGNDLTGAETGLVGHWPCRATVDAAPQIVLDLSTRGNDAVVDGVVHNGVTRIAATGPLGPVTALRNDDVIDVAADRWYSESFEFFVDDGTVGLESGHIEFDWEFRGLDQRGSSAWRVLDAAFIRQSAPELLADGWRRVRAQFMVPASSGITAMRTFGLSDVRFGPNGPVPGSALLLRNHTWAYEANAISRAVSVVDALTRRRRCTRNHDRRHRPDRSRRISSRRSRT